MQRVAEKERNREPQRERTLEERAPPVTPRSTADPSERKQGGDGSPAPPLSVTSQQRRTSLFRSPSPDSNAVPRTAVNHGIRSVFHARSPPLNKQSGAPPASPAAPRVLLALSAVECCVLVARTRKSLRGSGRPQPISFFFFFSPCWCFPRSCADRWELGTAAEFASNIVPSLQAGRGHVVSI